MTKVVGTATARITLYLVAISITPPRLLPVSFPGKKRNYIEYMRAQKAASSSKTMTLRLDPGTLRRLDGLAQATDRSRAWLAAQAVRIYLDLNEWPD